MQGRESGMSDVLTVLLQATKTRRCAIIRYAGQQQIRVVEPHAIYTDAAGNIVADCLQTRGHSSPDAVFPFWQTFHLKHISSVFLLNINFEVRIQEGFQPDSEKYQQGLLAMAMSASSSVRYQRKEKPVNLLFYQARGWWWGVGDALDRVLSDKDWSQRDH
jgi:hypothetical protein